MNKEEIIDNASLPGEEEEILHEHFRFKVDPGQSPVRIDKYLLGKIEAISRNKIQSAADEEMILVNGAPVRSSYKVHPLDEIVIMLPEPKINFELLPENIPLNIIYEDDDVLIVNKPAGLVVHPGAGNFTSTMVNGLLFHLQNLPPSTVKRESSIENRETSIVNRQSSIVNDIRPGLVHRIDKNTSGLVVIAKNDFALNFLQKQFSDHTIERTYVALVWGDFKEDEGTIIGNIGRSLKNRKVMDVFPEGDHGKEAITHYKVLERFTYVTLVECKLETGRTHQIRAHMKYTGHPLFNDDTYGGNKIVKGTVYSKYKQFVENCFSIIPRHALHAKTIGFIHPSTRKEVIFDSELPEDMMKVIEKWRGYVAK